MIKLQEADLIELDKQIGSLLSVDDNHLSKAIVKSFIAWLSNNGFMIVRVK